ncbi:ATP-binding protein [Candidatus Pacearchaeota archaeon]|nr:ATP-binding protein [Candidatus Pacearchaeota archaeon]
MRFEKSDFGAEILSILTRGMYPDPKDAIREYIQNGVDAESKNISVKIRQNNIVIEDDGRGMNKEIMRRAVRLGVSDKNPIKDVGFMGIGIYSSFNLCDKLVIFSKTEEGIPNKLIFNFKVMREILEKQKELRFRDKVDKKLLMDLQTLMESHIELITINKEDFPKVGTRVEMIKVEPNFFRSLSKFEEVANYLQQVIPLPFNPEFKWGELIKNKINEICKKHNAVFELVNLNLQVNEQEEVLYRPYLNDHFDGEPLQPNFYELKDDDEFFGVAWGSLNPKRSVIKNKELRGFLIKRQGFAIGKRDNIVKYFVRPTYFNRYIGEIIVVNQHLIPNAPRTDFEFSELRISFYDCLRKIASTFNTRANTYQENSRSDKEIDEVIKYVRETREQLNFFSDNSDKLLDFLIDLREYAYSLKRRLNSNLIRKNREDDAKKIIKITNELIKEIKELIEKKKKKSKLKTDSEVSEKVEEIPTESKKDGELEFETLVDVVESLGIDVSEDLKKMFSLIDEQFIQTSSENKEDYFQLLKNIRQSFDELDGGD